ncbi:hypothetical protein SDC9_126799 [bioreactor metagenome]|uniref:Uncharacterized protein n=1 Tax=bioreactor metagenome TaxID=1076179 RepID=A0A645CSB8_9ZZZZ
MGNFINIVASIILGILCLAAVVVFFSFLGGEELIFKIRLKLTNEKTLIENVKFLYENFNSLSEAKVHNRLYGVMKTLNLLYRKYSVLEVGTNFRKIKDGCDGKWSICRTYLHPFFYNANGVEKEPQWEKDEALPIAYHLYKTLID